MEKDRSSLQAISSNGFVRVLVLYQGLASNLELLEDSFGILVLLFSIKSLIIVA